MTAAEAMNRGDKARQKQKLLDYTSHSGRPFLAHAGYPKSPTLTEHANDEGNLPVRLTTCRKEQVLSTGCGVSSPKSLYPSYV